MRGLERLAAVDRSAPPMATALPGLPMTETTMVRLMRIGVVGLGQFFEPVFREIGLAEGSFHVLCLLIADPRGQASPSALADLVGTSRANMTRILDILVADQFVLRTTEARDARRSVVQITPRGRSMAEDAIPQLVDPLTRAFEDLTPAEMETLALLLRKATRSFDKGAQPMRAGA